MSDREEVPHATFNTSDPIRQACCEKKDYSSNLISRIFLTNQNVHGQKYCKQMTECI
jgi:hypothetical protein